MQSTTLSSGQDRSTPPSRPGTWRWHVAEGTGRRRLWGRKLRRVPGSGPRLESPSVLPSPSYSSPCGAVRLSEMLLVVRAVAGSHPLRATRRPSPPRSGCSPLHRPGLHGRSASPRRTERPASRGTSRPPLCLLLRPGCFVGWRAPSVEDHRFERRWRGSPMSTGCANRNPDGVGRVPGPASVSR
jgi:hypothetical protein